VRVVPLNERVDMILNEWSLYEGISEIRLYPELSKRFLPLSSSKYATQWPLSKTRISKEQILYSIQHWTSIQFEK
jgi:hypothetical protein